MGAVIMSRGDSTMTRASAGFSLVELMIALLLGSLITLAAVQLFGTNQRTFQLQQGLTDVQEQGRFALDFISRDLRIMGLRNPDVTTGPAPGVVLTDILVGTTTFQASEDGGNSGAANDRLTFSYQGRPGDMDCEGDAIAAAALIVNTYWVDDEELRCLGSVVSGSGGLTLVNGVESFQVLFGIDTDPNEVPSAGRYVRADMLDPADQVVSVRIGMLVRATQGNLPPLGPPQDVLVLDRELTAGNAPLTESAVRRLFVTTVRARNFQWESI
jgi:type IV pilus assembly protein PilW